MDRAELGNIELESQKLQLLSAIGTQRFGPDPAQESHDLLLR